MCHSYQPTPKKQFTGYKIVAKKVGSKDNTYYSILTGNPYPQGQVPVWISGDKGLGVFLSVLPRTKKEHDLLMKNGSITNNYRWWSKKMVGRTAVFVNKKEAIKERKEWDITNNMIGDRYRLVVVKVRLTKDLLKAKFSFNMIDVYAGKHMKILEEVA